jgi:TolA-binding protein
MKLLWTIAAAALAACNASTTTDNELQETAANEPPATEGTFPVTEEEEPADTLGNQLNQLNSDLANSP